MQSHSLSIDRSNLFPSQIDLIEAGYLTSEDNWLICAPTGAGKTRMAEWALLQAVKSGRRAAYTAPLKAIVEEKCADWAQKYPEISIGLYTGDTTRSKRSAAPADEPLLLFTPEKLAAYVQAWKRNLSWLAQLNVLVVDEFHLLGDPGRGPGLEALLGRLKRLNPFIRIIALSATLSNARELVDWMPARLFVSDWRPVPVQKRIVRFKKVAEKIDLLVTEIIPTLSDGGKALVFVNSRRRSEAIARHLQAAGIQADFNHAGLDRKQRTRTQNEMRQGKLDVVVATSTLEMGVNFPARKVIIYDAYGFDGENFTPLSVQRYLQYSGRAGRAGYDTEGESVLFLPAWDTNRIDYLSAPSEPVSSGLFRTDALLREILTEVSGRLSISLAHLETNFVKPTLWRRQGGQRDLTGPVRQLIEANLLKESDTDPPYLSETPLGRVAAQMGILPQSIRLLVGLYREYPFITDFDLLLACGLCGEVTPKLGFNFEEIDPMADLILSIPSQILEASHSRLFDLDQRISEKRTLSAVKYAVLLYQHIQGETVEALAERYDCYPLDIEILKRNTGWVLETAQRVFGILWREQKKKEEDGDAKGIDPTPCQHEQVCRDLRTMVQYAVPRNALDLVAIKGIGARRAGALIKAGILTPATLQKTPTETLAKILHLKPGTIEQIVQSARDITAVQQAEDPFADPLAQAPLAPPPSTYAFGATHPDIDPYRLRRALELRVDHASRDLVRVSGGAEPHTVTVLTAPPSRTDYHCDCVDFAKGHRNCKHIIRARLELRDDRDILDLLKRLQDPKDRPLRFALGELWIRISGLYDAFNGREVDYTGRIFLDRAQARKRWSR